jgi:hypothetical protein
MVVRCSSVRACGGPSKITLPPGHADDALGKAAGQIDVVHVHDHRDAVLAAQVAHQRHDLHRGARVQRRGGLVGQQQRRLLHQRARDAHALALAARERIGAPVGEPGQADLVEQFERAIDVGPRKAPQPGLPGRHIAQAPAEQVLHHRQALDQVVLLEHHADLAARLAQGAARQRARCPGRRRRSGPRWARPGG